MERVGFVYRETFPKDGCDVDWIDREIFVLTLDEEQPEETNEDKS
jgi:hypothetical protein